jgi:phospholipid/cholesterol/gamma-HCH transport system permease protein
MRSAIAELQAYTLLIGRVAHAAFTRPFYRRDVVEQMNAIGAASLVLVLLTGAFTGMVLVLQTGATFDRYGARTVVGRIVGASLVRELGPVLTALMLTGRAGAGIAAELGSMAVTYQIDALRVLGSDPIRKLIVPRVIAGAIMLPLLTILADAIGIIAGGVMASTQLRVAMSLYWQDVVYGLQLADIWMGLVKSLVFGVVITSMSGYLGLNTTGGTRGVGVATNRAVVTCSIAILALNFFITRLLMALLY